MMRNIRSCILIATAFFVMNAPALAQTLTGPAAHLYRQAQSGRWFADAAKLNPDILPTSDGQSFIVVWKAAGKEPTRWIVSLHGTRGFATDDLAIWYPHLKNRDVGLLSVQWWIGPDRHGALQCNPKNARRVLDLFLNERP